MSSIDQDSDRPSSYVEQIYAVQAQSLEFGYNKNTTIIKNFSLKINQGEIFALLGSNGCGKTTVIKLILGLKQPKNGWVKDFGVHPGVNSDIPGPNVGYMPQESALFFELSVGENLSYFSKLYMMNSIEFHLRYNKLTKLLNLKPRKRIDELSGGQQRLVSLAIALIHRPKLIILDEPTVGVDAIMVDRIWRYLEELTRNKERTILITTHYIEEARRATLVGFMKSGSILKQGNPQYLMEYYQKKTLEEVYLDLWHLDDLGDSNVVKQSLTESTNGFKNSLNRVKTLFMLDQYPIINRIILLIGNLHLRTKRIPLLFVLLLAIPLFTMTSLSLAIGQTPSPTSLSVYSPESQSGLSKQFIDSIDGDWSIVTHHNSRDSAINSVLKGDSYIAIVFADNFTEDFETRLQYPLDLSDEMINTSTIKLFVDNTRSASLLRSYKYLGQSLFKFVRNISETLNLNPDAFSLPMTFEETIYGDHPITGGNRGLFDFFAPVVYSDILQFSFMCISAYSLILLRDNSMLNRYISAGGKTTEVIISVYIYNSLLILVQNFFALFCAWLFFNIKQEGSYFEVYIMFVMRSLQGMTIGVFIALLAESKINTAMSLAFLMIPQYFVSGEFWPIESVPGYFRIFAEWGPQTKPIDSLRSIMLRGWPLTHPKVLIGFIVCLFYSLILSLFTLIFSKFVE